MTKKAKPSEAQRRRVSASSAGYAALSESEKEVLNDLIAWAYDEGWARPMDVGGTDASHHSRTLQRLVKLGYAESRQRHVGISSGSKLYRALPPNDRTEVLRDSKRSKDNKL